MRRFFKISVVWLCIFAFPAVSFAQYDTDMFFNRGRRLLSEGKFSQSMENFNILASLDTTNCWTFFFRGIAKYNLGDIRGARRDFDRSVRLNPVFTSGYHYRAIAESRSGDYESALKDLEKAIGLRPGHSGLYFSRGVTYFLSRQFDKAVSDFDWYIRREPADPAAYLNRGAALLFQGDTTRALSDYDKAISLDPKEPEGYLRRGRLYAASGRMDEGIADMDKALKADSTSTFAYFNRALMYFDKSDYNAAMADLDKVLEAEPGNALTLYNRSLIFARTGDYASALYDMDRVININPSNVLAYFNRASYFVNMGRWADALQDYDKAIELYPDFAKAYMNRSYVENRLGMTARSKADYKTAQQKINEYRAKNSSEEVSFADTTRKYSSLLALDADFAKKDFDNELLQHRDVDIRLRPLYKFVFAASRQGGASSPVDRRYENALVSKFVSECPVPIAVSNADTLSSKVIEAYDGAISSLADDSSVNDFLKGLSDVSQKRFNSALAYYDKAVDRPQTGRFERLYKAFYLMNRGVLRAEMIEFLSSMESNVQTLSMDDRGTVRARVKDQVSRSYDYSQALADMEAAVAAAGDIAWLHFNLGNLRCLSSKLIDAIDSYTSAIVIYPYMGDAYFNRGLVLVYLKDKEKGCIDLSKAGELGVKDAYAVISRYCSDER